MDDNLKPNPRAVHLQEDRDNDSGGGWLGWLIGALVIAALIWAAIMFFDVDQTEDGNFDVSGGNLDVDLPEVDASLPEFDVEAGDVDVDLPEVTLPSISVEGGDISGGDVDVTLPGEGPEADDVSPLDGVGTEMANEIDEAADVDVDVDVDVDEE